MKVLLVAGGADQRASTSTSTEVLTPGSDTWTLATPLPKARSSLAGVTIDNRLYMTGTVLFGTKTTLFGL